MREVWSLTTWHAQHVPSTAAETVVASPSGSCHRLRRVPKPAVPVARLGTVGWRKMICHARRQGESGGWPDDLALTAPASPQERAGRPLLGRRMALRSARGRKRPSAPTSWPAVSGTPRKSGCVPPEIAGSYAERGDRGRGRGVERWRRGTLRVQRCGRPRGGTRTRPAPPLLSHDSMAATASLTLTAA